MPQPSSYIFSYIDTRNAVHAEISDWIPSDARCRRRNYTAEEACDAIRKSNFTKLYFVGDSLIAKLYRAFLLTINSDPNYGSIAKSFTDELKRKCVGRDQFYWPQCRHIGVSLDNLVNKSSMCDNGRPPFKAFSYSFYDKDRRENFLNLVKNLTNKNGTFFLVGVGLHMNCKAQSVIDKYLAPAVNYKEEYYSRIRAENSTKIPLRDQWPRMMFIPPDMPGLLKPLMYLDIQGPVPCKKISEKMKQYCDEHEIPVLNFESLTESVHSFDGTHYGMGVNLMKVQILLNYIESNGM